MPFNGSGGFVPLASPQFPAVANTTIIADYYNNNLNDIFAGLGACVTRDGQSPATANLPMGGFKHTGASGAAGGGQYVVWGQTEAVSLGGNLTVAGATTLTGGLSVPGGMSLTSPITVTWGTPGQFRARSGAADKSSWFDAGRTAAEMFVGVSGNSNALTAGDVAGDATLRSEQRLWLSVGATGLMKFDLATGITARAGLSAEGTVAPPAATGVRIGTTAGFPSIAWHLAAAPADNKNWDNYADGDSLFFRTLNDARNTAVNWMQVVRTGTNIEYIVTNGKLGVGMVPSAMRLELRASPATGNTDGLRIQNAAATLSTQLLITGPGYNYAGVGANQAWLYSQGTMDLNIGPDGGGTLAFVQNGARRLQIGGGLTTSFQTLWAQADNGFRVTNAGNTVGGYLQAIPGVGTRLTSDTANIVFNTTGSDRFAVDTAGRISGSALHNNVAGMTGLTQYIGSGSYMPTFSPIQNAASPSLTSAIYTRVGRVVCVSGSLSIATTAGTAPAFLLSFPIPSTAPTVAGVAFLGGSSAGNSMAVSTVSNQAYFSGALAGSTGAVQVFYQYQYDVR